MDKPKEFVYHLAESKIDRLMRTKRAVLVTNILILIFIMCAGYYVATNIEEFKSLDSDVCKMCYEETQKQCGGRPNCFNRYFAPESGTSNLSLNLSGFIPILNQTEED